MVVVEVEKDGKVNDQTSFSIPVPLTHCFCVYWQPGNRKKVTLKRMATEKIADRRALFELFVNMRNASQQDPTVSDYINQAMVGGMHE